MITIETADNGYVVTTSSYDDDYLGRESKIIICMDEAQVIQCITDEIDTQR
jgi:hypothetical protein